MHFKVPSFQTSLEVDLKSPSKMLDPCLASVLEPVKLRIFNQMRLVI